MLQLFTFTPELAHRTAQVIEKFQSDSSQFPLDKIFLEPVKEFVTGGKLFRGSLCLTVSQLLDGTVEPSPAAWSTAMALELAGSAILAQDDVMDAALTRRGNLALHQQYAKSCPGGGVSSEDVGVAHFGETVAACIEDVLFFMATQLLTEADCSAEQRLALVKEMSQEITMLALAQAEDNRFALLPLDDSTVTEKAILQIMLGKTARYTAQWPLASAGILASADAPTLAALKTYGEAAGIVFQLSDDRLGLFGDPEQTGKDVDSDAKTGKKTLYALYAHKNLTGSAAKTFHQLYGKADLSVSELYELQELLEKEGVTTLVDQVVSRYLDQAQKTLLALKAWPKLQAILAETVEFLATRRK